MKEKWKGNEKGKGVKERIYEICKVTEAERDLTYFCAVYCCSMTATLKVIDTGHVWMAQQFYCPA